MRVYVGGGGYLPKWETRPFPGEGNTRGKGGDPKSHGCFGGLKANQFGCSGLTSIKESSFLCSNENDVSSSSNQRLMRLQIRKRKALAR